MTIISLKDIISKSENNTDFIYRGCACESYDLVPTLARKLKSSTSFENYSAYADIVEREAKKGYKEVNISGQSEDISQHYGLNTSYLDWSYSVYVALYFAFTSYLKQFVDENILARHIDFQKIHSLRDDFNGHKYCLFKFNKTLYAEMKQQYQDLPLTIVDTDKKNKRMNAQRGLLSKIENEKVKQISKIRDSQIKIIADWLRSNNPSDSLEQIGDKYVWNKKILLEKQTYKLSQRDRNCLQNILEENDATSKKLFPDFEGVKKNIEFSEDYNILRDLEIAYHEPSPHSLFKSVEDVNKILTGDQKTINAQLNTDKLGGEFFPFE